MNRLIIESVEGRITLGIVMFVAIMILVGWVAINEPARMASFTEQQNGRAIERGGELFAANCSSCHGKDGEGSGLAPALNNPHFFGHDFMAPVTDELLRVQREESELQNVVIDLERRKEEALTEFNALTDEQRNGDAGHLLLVEIGNIDARLLDDPAAVEARLAAITSGAPATEDANPALTDAEVTARQEALSTNIPNRLREIGIALNGDGTEDNIGLLAERQAIIDQFAGARLNGYMPRLDLYNQQLADGDISPLEYTAYLQADADRLSQVGFGGTIESYILTTLIHGRPGSNVVWGTGGMVSWSQRGGGSLRDDQIRDLIAYIMNWDKGDNWQISDLASVNQFARLHEAYDPTSGGGGEEIPVNEPPPATACASNPDCVAGVGTTREIAATLPTGDAANGATLYAQNACVACHVGGVQAPDLAGTVARVEAERLTLEDFEGWTVDEYLVTSIIYPDHFVVDGYSPIMPATFGQTLNLQQLADIIAYIKEQ